MQIATSVDQTEERNLASQIAFGGADRRAQDDTAADHRRQNCLRNKAQAARYSVTETFDVGMDLSEPVSNQYNGPFRFSGKLVKVTVELK